MIKKCLEFAARNIVTQVWGGFFLAFIGYGIGLIIGYIFIDFFGLFKSYTKQEIAATACVISFLVGVMFLSQYTDFLKTKSLYKIDDENDYLDEIVYNMDILRGFSLPPMVEFKGFFSGGTYFYPIITNKRLLFISPSSLDITLPALGRMKRNLFGSKDILEKAGKTDNANLINNNIIMSLKLKTRFYREYIIKDIKELHVEDDGSFVIELDGEKYKYGLHYTSLNYKNSLIKSLRLFLKELHKKDGVI